MARVILVKTARASKVERRCFRCPHVIEPGESYKHVSLKTGPYSSITRYWCSKHPPRQSELTVNSRLSALYSIQESLEDDCASYQKGELGFSELKEQVSSAADEAESIADEYEESADNMPDSLQSSSQADELRDKAEAVRDWASTLRNCLDEFDAGDDTVCKECSEDIDAPQHDDEGEDWEHNFEPDVPDKDEVENAITAAVSELSI